MGKFRLGFLVVALVASNALASSLTGTYVGKVSGSNAFIAIVTEKGKATAYVCDSNQIAEWFRGDVSASGTINLTSESGARLQASVASNAFSGMLILKGNSALSFTTVPATGKAGFYLAEKTVNGIEYYGGWVVLVNGEQRGAVVGGGTLKPKKPGRLNTDTLRSDVPGLGTLEASRATAVKSEW